MFRKAHLISKGAFLNHFEVVRAVSVVRCFPVLNGLNTPGLLPPGHFVKWVGSRRISKRVQTYNNMFVFLP